ncbi:MAG: aminodeoxychorismate/anthranilate synthase component II [Cyclobacteriaceae bacterium]|nr:aminodeoxychorismate/anthranilate synthase component II [Cyclobacteriaceae bacterium]
MKILVLDNYDSFTYNLVHLIRANGFSLDIIRNDKIDLSEIKKYDKILLSPGPGIPEEAGIMKPLVKEYGATKSILGICLGHQGIAEVYGASLYNIPSVLHGVTSMAQITSEEEYLFNGVPQTFQATHYHSWAVRPDSLTPDLKVTSTNTEGMVMAISHVRYDVKGFQFHPESIMTPDGPKMIKNWLNDKSGIA